MTTVTPYDGFTRVTRELSIPALDMQDNFFPIDSYSDSNSKTAKSQTSDSFSVKSNTQMPAIVTFQANPVDRISTNKKLNQAFPSVTKKGQKSQWKTEYFERNTQADGTINEEPVVVITQVYTTYGSSINTGESLDTLLMNHYAAIRSQGDAQASLDYVMEDRLIHGGTSPVGIR